MSVELSDLLSWKKKDVKNPHNDGLVSASLKEFIEKTQKLWETSSIIRDILKNPKQFTINQLLRAIEEVENQGSYSAEVDYQRTIEEIKSIVYDNLSDYKICYERYFRKISTRLAKHLDYFKKGPVIIWFWKKEIRCSEPIGESNPWLVLGTNYPFVDYTPNCWQEFFCISTSPDEIKARQKVIWELQKIVDKDVLKFLDIFWFIDEINFNKLLYSRTYERDYSDDDYNGYLLAAYYWPGLYTEQQESDEYRPRESVSYKEKWTYNYYEEVANYIMSILDKIGQVPWKLRIIIEKLKDIPSLQDYILDLESALSESEYFFSLESFTAWNPFFDALKFVNEKKRKKESEIDKSKGARIDKMLALVDVNDNWIDDKGFINNWESEFVLAERYNAHLKIIEKLLEKLQKIKNLINIAYHVKSNEWNQVSLNNEEKTEYRDWWHPWRQIWINSIWKEGEVYFHPIDRNQVVNDSPADASLIIYSWANTSWKTFSWLQRDFFIRIAMQSFWYAPVETWNIAELYDMIVYFDRASTNSKDKKSAYMSEISRLKNLFEACQWKSMLLYYDEPFSTTSPIDQSAMIESLVAYIHARWWKCIIATHNEVFIKSQKSNPNTKCYFFPIVDWKCTRILTPWVWASDFIDVAKREWFNLDTINNAEAYLDWSLTILKTIHPNIDLSVWVWNSAKSLFPDLSEWSNPIFWFLSDDSDFDFAKWVWKFRFDDAFSNLDRVIIQRMLAKMIYYAPELTIQAIKERQNLFLELLQNSNYQEIAKLCSYLVEVEENFMSLEGVWINQKLCPIQIWESRIEYQIVDMLDLDKYDWDCNSITKMIRYLWFNRIIFWKLSKEADWLKKKLITFRKKLKLFQDSIDNQRKDYFTRKKKIIQ